MNAEQSALALAKEIVSLWLNWSDETEVETELAMREAFKQVEALDLAKVCGTLAQPLNYFTQAFLHDVNPEDLTYGEMVESIEIGIGAK